MSDSATPRWWWLDPEAADHDRWPHVLPGTWTAARQLSALGIRPAERVALGLVNTPGCAAVLLALPLLGATGILINRRLSDREVTLLANSAGVDRAVSDHAHPLIRWEPPLPTAPDDGEDDLPPPQVPAPHTLPETFPEGRPVRGAGEMADPSLVLFTSGTTGRPKAARLSYDAIIRAADAANAHLGLTAADGWLCPLPIDHIGGAATVIRAARGGHRLLLCERFDAALVNQLIDEQAVTGLSVVPTQLHRLVEDRAGRPWPARLRCILTGGGPLDAGLIARCTDLGRAPSQTYGLTEACSQVTTLRPDEAADHSGTAGTPLPGVRLRLRIQDREAAPGEIGVIEVGGGTLFRGYERDGELDTLAGAWFVTGDLGSRDEAGFLTVHGRRDDLIISGGENVHPTEVEDILAQHPSIAEAAVAGLSDDEWGQVVVAVLVARAERPTDAELTAWLSERIAGFKRPRRWRWVEALPRTATGKLRRGDCAGLFESIRIRKE
jgi:O-succinylbenzoic acid--CoA ligase